MADICVPRWPQDAPRRGQDGLKMVPRRVQDGTRTAKGGHVEPRWFRKAQKRENLKKPRKTKVFWPHVGRSWRHLGGSWRPSMASRRPKTRPRRPKMAPKTRPRRHQYGQGGHVEPSLSIWIDLEKMLDPFGKHFGGFGEDFKTFSESLWDVSE